MAASGGELKRLWEEVEVQVETESGELKNEKVCPRPSHEEWFQELLSESQGQNLVLTVLYVSYSLNRERSKVRWSVFPL